MLLVAIPIEIKEEKKQETITKPKTQIEQGNNNRFGISGCLTAETNINSNNLYIYKCNSNDPKQKFIHNENGNIKSSYTNKCLDVYAQNNNDNSIVAQQVCNEKDNQRWLNIGNNKFSPLHALDKCLTANINKRQTVSGVTTDVVINKCDEKDFTQNW